MPEALEIIAGDQTPISATLYKKSQKSPHLIIIGSATGVPQRFYQNFAQYASGYADFDVVTFDYRGIGQSLHSPIRKSHADMSDWGKQDLNAIIEWADQQYDKIYLVGHSVAGQIMPKADNIKRLSAAYLVASQSAYHRHWKGFRWLLILVFWKILIPLTTSIVKYLPGWTMGGNIPIPKKAALEWRSWSQHENGMILDDQQMREAFASVRMPLHFVSFEDDQLMAPSAATQALMHYYSNAVTTFQYIKPADIGLGKIGHFGFFKKKFKKTALAHANVLLHPV